jgi:3-oxoacyl-[acyl-carrier protein] reductase
MKTLLLTGGTGEIGAAIAQKFRENSYEVIAPNRTTLDLEKKESIEKYLSGLKCSIDAFVHCAGFNEPKSILSITLDDINKTFQINAFSFYEIIRFLMKENRIKQGGHIVGISSIYGSLARKGRFSYVSSKHALHGMIKTLSLELGQLAIKANVVSPGFVDTKMTRKNNTEEKIKGFVEKIPLGRLASTHDIANVVYFMCSPENTYITGQELIVDGGYSMGGFES